MMFKRERVVSRSLAHHNRRDPQSIGLGFRGNCPIDRVIRGARTYLGRGARGGRLAEVTRERGARGEFDSLRFA